MVDRKRVSAANAKKPADRKPAVKKPAVDKTKEAAAAKRLQEEQAAAAKKAAIEEADSKIVDAQDAVKLAEDTLAAETDDEKKAELLQNLQAANQVVIAAKAHRESLNVVTPPLKTETKPTATQPAAEKEEQVMVNVPKPFKLLLPGNKEISFTVGAQKVARSVSEHWWCVANGMTVAK